MSKSQNHAHQAAANNSDIVSSGEAIRSISLKIVLERMIADQVCNESTGFCTSSETNMVMPECGVHARLSDLTDER